MKKHLMAGTALIAATMLVAGGAVAADKKMMKPSISVNGYYDALISGTLEEEHKRGGQDMAPDEPAVDVWNDAEIHFNGRATTDNGMKIHARVELEGAQHHSTSDPIDEYFLSVSGSFGQIIIGGTGGAPVKMLTGLSGSWATSVGETLSFDVNDRIPNAGVSPAGAPRGHGHYAMQHSRLDTGDAQKVTYISPKLGGFQLGVTYSPTRNNGDDNSANVNTAGPHDGLEGAVNYSGKFGDVGFAIGAGMTSYQGADDAVDDDRSDWLVAGRIDFGGGFRVAAAHKQVTDENKAQQGQLTDVGVRFAQGANSFSLVGVVGEMDNSQASYTAVMGSYARALGPGMKVHLNVIGTESESSDGNAENSGIVSVAGLKVVF